MLSFYEMTVLLEDMWDDETPVPTHMLPKRVYPDNLYWKTGSAAAGAGPSNAFFLVKNPEGGTKLVTGGHREHGHIDQQMDNGNYMVKGRLGHVQGIDYPVITVWGKMGYSAQDRVIRNLVSHLMSQQLVHQYSPIYEDGKYIGHVSDYYRSPVGV